MVSIASVETTSADFLKITTGSRNAAMGEAGAMINTDIESVALNAGAVGVLENPQFMLEHAEWFGNVRYESFSASIPLSKDPSQSRGVVFGQIQYLYVSAFPIFDDWGLEINSAATFQGMKASVGYALRFIQSPYVSLSAGGNLSFIRKSIVDSSAWTPSLDAGFFSIIRHGVDSITPFLGDFFNFSLAFYNVDPMFKKGTDTLPMSIKAGFGFHLFRVVGIGFDTPVFLDGSAFRADVGAEYWFRDLIALRVGSKIGSGVISPLTMGLGLKQKVGFNNLQLDYALIPYGEGLGMTHRMSLKFELAPEETPALRLQRAELLYYQGVAAFIKGDFPKAEKFLREALKKRPEYPDAQKRIDELRKIRSLEEKYK